MIGRTPFYLSLQFPALTLLLLVFSSVVSHGIAIKPWDGYVLRFLIIYLFFFVEIDCGSGSGGGIQSLRRCRLETSAKDADGRSFPHPFFVCGVICSKARKWAML